MNRRDLLCRTLLCVLISGCGFVFAQDGPVSEPLLPIEESQCSQVNDDYGARVSRAVSSLNACQRRVGPRDYRPGNTVPGCKADGAALSFMCLEDRRCVPDATRFHQLMSERVAAVDRCNSKVQVYKAVQSSLAESADEAVRDQVEVAQRAAEAERLDRFIESVRTDPEMRSVQKELAALALKRQSLAKAAFETSMRELYRRHDSQLAAYNSAMDEVWRNFMSQQQAAMQLQQATINAQLRQQQGNQESAFRGIPQSLYDMLDLDTKSQLVRNQHDAFMKSYSTVAASKGPCSKPGAKALAGPCA